MGNPALGVKAIPVTENSPLQIKGLEVVVIRSDMLQINLLIGNSKYVQTFDRPLILGVSK